MKTNQDYLRENLESFITKILRNCNSWYSLNINVYITHISEHKVRLTIALLAARYFYLKSSRRKAIAKIKEILCKELGIKKEWIIDVEYGEVQKSENVEYVESCIKYLIPKEIYNKLETLIAIDKQYLKDNNIQEFEFKKVC